MVRVGLADHPDSVRTLTVRIVEQVYVIRQNERGLAGVTDKVGRVVAGHFGLITVGVPDNGITLGTPLVVDSLAHASENLG